MDDYGSSKSKNTERKNRKETSGLSMPFKKILGICLLTSAVAACIGLTAYACSSLQKTYVKSTIRKKTDEILHELEKCVYDRKTVNASLCRNGGRSLNSFFPSAEDYGGLFIEGIRVSGFDTETEITRNTDIAAIEIRIRESVFYPASIIHYAVQITPDQKFIIHEEGSDRYIRHFESADGKSRSLSPEEDSAEKFWNIPPYRDIAEADTSEKIRLLKALPEDEYGRTEVLLAGILYDNGDSDTAVNLYRTAAAKGSRAALYQLALIYLNGTGDMNDSAKGISYLTEAAEHGSNEALNHLGTLLTDGTLIPENHDMAAEYFRKAADNGSAEGFYNLGKSIINGANTGLPSSAEIKSACSAFRSAYELHYEKHDIYAYLGDCLISQDSDIIGAHRLYRKGVQLNQPLSLVKTANLLTLADPTDRESFKEAEELLLRAVALRHPEAYGNLSRLYFLNGRMDEAERYALEGSRLHDSGSADILNKIRAVR